MPVNGHFALFLHTHLPFVRHPEHEYFLEEHWLFEAVAECYLPLLRNLWSLARDEVPFRASVALSPPVCSMLADDLLGEKFRAYLDRTLMLCGLEESRNAADPVFLGLARWYRGRFAELRRFWEEELGGDVLSGFRRLADSGHLDLLTCGATHGFLPLLAVAHPASVEAQVAVAVQTHRRLLGRDPAGIMLPECAYYEGLEEVLGRHGLRFFLLDSHGLLFGRPRPLAGVFAPVFCPNGVAAFGRDHESSRQVWSAKEGYPGDPAYREFYRDLGFDREMDYIRPFVSPDGARTYTGIKYHRVTGEVPLSQKEPYHPAAAMARAEEHAANFVFNRERQAEHLKGLLGRPPVVVSPYDTELFGHWWFEGPDFLEKVFRRLAQPGVGVRPVTLREYLEENTFHQVLRPNPSSWGDKGYYEVWLNGSNDWAWRHVHHASIRMGELARKHRRADPLRRRALAQAAREVLLAQASDWPFLLTMGTAVEYATRRLSGHLERFRALEGMVEGTGEGGVDEGRLAAIEAQDNIFPDIEYQVFA